MGKSFKENPDKYNKNGRGRGRGGRGGRGHNSRNGNKHQVEETDVEDWKSIEKYPTNTDY